MTGRDAFVGGSQMKATTAATNCSCVWERVRAGWAGADCCGAGELGCERQHFICSHDPQSQVCSVEATSALACEMKTVCAATSTKQINTAQTVLSDFIKLRLCFLFRGFDLLQVFGRIFFEILQARFAAEL